MTIPSNVTRNSYTGTGITGPYPVTFKFFEDADLKVTVADTNGVETVKTLTTDYTVTGAGEQAGGSITFTTAVTTGYSIVIEPKADLTQDTDIKNEGGNLREAIEDRFDRLCRDDQVQQNLIDRSVKVKITDVDSLVSSELPSPVAGAGLGWDANGTKLINTFDLSGVSDVSGLTVTATGSAVARTMADHAVACDAIRNSTDVLSYVDGAKINISAGSQRSVIRYASANSVKVYGSATTLDGFLWYGSRTRRGLIKQPASFETTVSVASDLGAESAVATENWYAVFAVANSASANLVYKLMPVLRAGSVAGSVVTLNKAGEAIHTVVGKSYSWSSTNNLSGCACLVLKEAGVFGGRITSITANNASSVTVETIGSIAAGDVLCVAPPGYSEYKYVGCFYYDTAEVRNIADAGGCVYAKMVAVSDPAFSTSGAVASPTKITLDGYISPFAKAAVVDSIVSLTTASLGSYAEYFSHDSSGHVIRTVYVDKEASPNLTIANSVVIPFSVSQSFYYSNAGSVNSARASAVLEVTGWIE